MARVPAAVSTACRSARLVGWRKLLQAVEEFADVGSDAGTRAAELGLQLLQLLELGVQTALLLRLLVQLDFEDRVALALDLFKHHPGADADGP